MAAGFPESRPLYPAGRDEVGGIGHGSTRADGVRFMSIVRERSEDGVELLRLDRPAARNAMDTALLETLLAALAELAADPSLRVLVIGTTSPGALSAGADVAETLDAAGGVRRMERFTELYAAVEAFPLPTIAVCVGNVVGAGAELAAGCDVRVGGDNLKLTWVGARLGVPVGPARLIGLVGLGRAKELIFSSRVIGLQEALDIGFLQEGGPAEEAEARAVALARTIAGRSPAGVRQLKALFREFEGGEARVARENEGLIAFQREGAGLPRR
jgi:enoyl-CoA hydratase/carnithine racemase